MTTKKPAAKKKPARKKPARKKPTKQPAKRRPAKKRSPAVKSEPIVGDDADSTAAALVGDDAKIEMYRRLLQVEQLMGTGASVREIVAWATVEDMRIDKRTGLPSKPWKVSEQTAKEYIRRVRDAWRTTHDDARPDYRHEVRAQLKLLCKLAIQAGKYTAAVRAIDLRCRLDALYEPERVIHSIEDISEAEADELIRHAYDTLNLGKRRERASA